MKVLVLVFSLMISVTLGEYKEDCKEGETMLRDEQECNSTNYDAYLKCLRQYRMKRSYNCRGNNGNACEDSNSCSTSCDECSCGECNTGCQYTGSCNSCCSTCCQPTSYPCTTNHCCHKVCHASCRNSDCRSSCKQSCYDHVNSRTHHGTNTATSVGGNTSVHSELRNLHNITTIIHVNNLVNNTNVIDTPINVNTTNVNNITLPASMTTATNHTTHQKYIQGCCTVYSPRICQPQDKFPFLRCFHYRYRMCGAQCNSNIMHIYNQPTCTGAGQGSCQQRQVLVPQPNPPCAYIPQWPYVTCGTMQQPSVNCQGCYQHYFGQDRLTSCNPFCYDNGFSTGPYFRQGPYYQPSYSPSPPCYMTGGCPPPYTYPYQSYAPQYTPGYLPGISQPFSPFTYPIINPMGYPVAEVQQNIPSVYGKSDNVENGSMSGVALINEPFLYNQLAFPYNYNIYPQSAQIENITHEPIIQAQVDASQDDRYAQIKIVPDGHTDDKKRDVSVRHSDKNAI